MKKGNEVSRTVKMLISGDVFGSEYLIRNLPYFSFLIFLGLVYIAIGYTAQDTVRQINKDKAELKEMRSEYITIKSDLMYTTKQSELARIVEAKGMGLKESSRPPKKIELTAEEWENYKTLATGD